MDTPSRSSRGKPVRLLIADDSLVFRRFIRDIFSSNSEVVVYGEAETGIEALDMVLKTRPDVILMDMEMPVMDGMTALQHLMIHCPTPTIMLSSLTSEGTTRALDTLKNGAVGFIGKENLFDGTDIGIFSMEITNKILNAASLKVQPVDPDFSLPSDKRPPKPFNRIVFCEDCGAKNIVDNFESTVEIQCCSCGDTIELEKMEAHRRNSYLTVFGGGEDCFRNLLNIIPRFEKELGGSILAVIASQDPYLRTLSEYLDSVSKIKVVRAQVGMELEEGGCYICAAREKICLLPYRTSFTLNSVTKLEEGSGAIDLAMTSASMTFKRKTAGILLSGSGVDGLEGMASIARHSGMQLLLHPSQCLSPQLVNSALESFEEAVVIENEKKIVEYLSQLYKNARQGLIR